MFALRFTPYRFFQCILIFYVSSEGIAGQTPKKCVPHNGYCLNQWDCCSNRCMSYMYRCTQANSVYPYPFLGVSFRPTVTLDQILEQNFGSANTIPVIQPKPYFASRFGGADDVAASEGDKIVTEKSEETTSEAATTLENLDILQETTTAVENQLGDEAKESRGDNILEATNTATEKQSCVEIGEKCFKNEDCCQNRCHGYLHQCVT